MLCLGYPGASLLVMTEEYAMTWPSLAVNYVFVAVILGTTLIYYFGNVCVVDNLSSVLAIGTCIVILTLSLYEFQVYGLHFVRSY